MMEALTKDTRFTELVEELQRKQENGEEIVMCEYIEIKGENRLAALLSKLYSLGRYEDAKLALDDRQVRLRLYEELCIV